jgi:hypothetical protein
MQIILFWFETILNSNFWVPRNRTTNICYHTDKRQKVKLSLHLTKHYAMKTYGEWTHRPHFSWPRHWLEVSDQLQALVALPTWKEPGYRMDRRQGGRPSRTVQNGEVKMFYLTRTRTSSRSCPAYSQLLKRGPLSLVSTTEELLDGKVAAPV